MMINEIKTSRICLVLETSGGGSGRHVLDLATGLRDRKQDVTIIWSPVRAEPGWVAAMKCLNGIKKFKLNMYRSVQPLDFQSWSRLAHLIRSTGPYDILHGHSSKAGALIRLLPKSISGKRVYTPHAFITMNPKIGSVKRKLYGEIERRLSRRGHTTITVGAQEQDHAKTLGLSGQIHTVVNGFTKNGPASRRRARKAIGGCEDEFLVGFVGRLSFQKNPQRFLSVVRHAARTSPKVRGVIIGDGELRSELESDASDTPGLFTFLGWQNAVELLPGLDAYLMTSRYEAMPYTLIEALAFGLPILSTHVGGTNETIVEGQNGYIFDQTETDDEVGRHLAELAEDTRLQQSFSSRSLEMSGERTVEKMVEKTLEIYRS